jgi:hypothetical protein
LQISLASVARSAEARPATRVIDADLTGLRRAGLRIPRALIFLVPIAIARLKIDRAAPPSNGGNNPDMRFARNRLSPLLFNERA